MRIPSVNRGRGLRFNLTPMIDVVFNLIIFFLAASHFARSEVAEDVRLPTAGGARVDADDSSQRVTATVLSDGRLLLGTREGALPQFETMLARGVADHGVTAVEVRIRTDERAPYGQIEPLLLACARQGVTKVRFAVLPE